MSNEKGEVIVPIQIVSWRRVLHSGRQFDPKFATSAAVARCSTATTPSRERVSLSLPRYPSVQIYEWRNHKTPQVVRHCAPLLPPSLLCPHALVGSPVPNSSKSVRFATPRSRNYGSNQITQKYASQHSTHIRPRPNESPVESSLHHTQQVLVQLHPTPRNKTKGNRGREGWSCEQ